MCLSGGGGGREGGREGRKGKEIDDTMGDPPHSLPITQSDEAKPRKMGEEEEE